MLATVMPSPRSPNSVHTRGALIMPMFHSMPSACATCVPWALTVLGVLRHGSGDLRRATRGGCARGDGHQRRDAGDHPDQRRAPATCQCHHGLLSAELRGEHPKPWRKWVVRDGFLADV